MESAHVPALCGSSNAVGSAAATSAATHPDARAASKTQKEGHSNAMLATPIMPTIAYTCVAQGEERRRGRGGGV